MLKNLNGLLLKLYDPIETEDLQRRGCRLRS